LSVLSLHGESKKQHTEGDCALFNTYSSSALPRAERLRPRIVCKSSPIGIANSAMPSRLLAMHSCSMLCFRLCHRLIAGGYHTVRCCLRRWLIGFILNGFWGLKSASVPHCRLR